MGFFKSMLTSDNGNPSFCRITGFICIIMYFIWGTVIAFKKLEIPDIPLMLGGVIIALYGINKGLTKTIQDKIDGQNK